ncbi:MAG: hypothetical protein G8237_03075 [Magnetococcales bacterium]|nr:hypothetical protein [Magnetococcales bacterium]NGZ05317.1 hypothetical protein [Magnetococcales bacterium]
MVERIHALAGLLAMLTMAVFWMSTVVAGLFLSVEAVIVVKQGIVLGLFVLIPLLMITGGSGMALGKKRTAIRMAYKQRRMILIVANGVLILGPAALFLSWRAEAGVVDGLYHGVQMVELLAGAMNLFLMGQNVRAGIRLRRMGAGGERA